MATYTLASFNIYKHLSDKRTLRDFRQLLKTEGLDVAGLQEIDWTIDAELPKVWKRHQSESNWARKDPIVWNADSVTMVEIGEEQIADPVPEGDKITPKRGATWVAFEEFIHINFHLNADVEGKPGHPKDNDRPEENYQAIRKVIDLADELQAEHKRPVVLSADFNVDYSADKKVKHRLFPYVNLTRAKFVCCWEDDVEESTRTANPRTGRTIDHLWVRGTDTHTAKFKRTRTPNQWPTGPIGSDHLPVITDLVIKKR